VSIPTFSITGKTALITGGNRGMGRAFALAFAEAGADVAICARDTEDTLKAVAEEIKRLGRRSLAIKADISRKADVESVVEKTVAEFGSIEILLNNSGIISRGFLFEADEDIWDQVIDTNLKGCYLCSQAVSKTMIERKRGNIINIASIAGLRALPERTAYSIAKGGVIMLTRVLARELGSHNIRVNAIAPGLVRTRMAELTLSDDQATERVLSDTPLGRVGETSDIVGAALFLASDAAGWITGHTIVVDGGRIA